MATYETIRITIEPIDNGFIATGQLDIGYQMVEIGRNYFTDLGGVEAQCCAWIEQAEETAKSNFDPQKARENF